MEITADMDFGSVKGACSEPDLLNMNGNSSSNPLSKPTGTDEDSGSGAAETDPSTPNASTRSRVDLSRWATLWAAVYVVGFGTGVI